MRLHEAHLLEDEPVPLETLAARRQVEAGLEREIAALRRLDWRKRALEVAVFGVVWILGGLVAVWGWEVEAPLLARLAAAGAGVLLVAVAINAFVLLLHDGMHGRLFANPAANRLASAAAGAPVFMAFSAYRVMHLRHHAYLGDPRDPDDYHNYTGRPALVWLLHFVRLTVGSFLYLALIPALALRHGTPVERRKIACEYLALAVVYGLVFWAVPVETLALVWLLPLVPVAYATNMRGFTQHGIADAHDPFLASRSIEASRLVRFVLLNENYHLEHHLFPEVPSYHLAELHRLVVARLPRRVTGRSYLAFIVRFLLATPRRDETPIGMVADQLAGARGPER